MFTWRMDTLRKLVLALGLRSLCRQLVKWCWPTNGIGKSASRRHTSRTTRMVWSRSWRPMLILNGLGSHQLPASKASWKLSRRLYLHFRFPSSCRPCSRNMKLALQRKRCWLLIWKRDAVEFVRLEGHPIVGDQFWSKLINGDGCLTVHIGMLEMLTCKKPDVKSSAFW